MSSYLLGDLAVLVKGIDIPLRIIDTFLQIGLNALIKISVNSTVFDI